MRTYHFSLCAAVLAATSMAGSASAQDGLVANLMPSFANSMVNTTVRDSYLGVDSFRGPGRMSRPSAPHGGRSLPPQLATTTYRRDVAITDRVKRRYVDWLARSSPQDGERARQALAATDPVRTWSRYVAEDGMHPGDVADAVASYWVLNWLIVNGGDSRPRQVQTVRRRLRITIAADPTFARLSEVQRQEMAEALMVNFIFQRDTYMHAVQTHDQPLLNKARAAAVTRFQTEAGVDLRRLLLTDDGFVNRG